MSDDDRPKFRVVSNDDVEVSKKGILTRELALGELDGNADFMAGIYVGVIISQLQQAGFASIEYDQLHPMPAAKTHLHVVERIAAMYKASLEHEAMSDDDEMVWCSFKTKRSTIRVVPISNNRKNDE